MTEHKFTDEEIIRAFEICQKAKCWGDCEDMGCPAATKQGCRFYLRTDEDYVGVIQDEMLKDALDLINRQRYEIDSLKDTLCGKLSASAAADVAPKSEVERLIDDFQRTIRADAKVGMSAGEILMHINNMLAELKKKYTEDKKDDRQAYS